MTTVQIKEWNPKQGHFTRYYVTDANTNEQIGYIQADFKSEGYGNGYYANHRAAKGDFGTEKVIKLTISGQTDILNAIIELAKSIHPAVKSGIRKATDAIIEQELDVELSRMSCNPMVKPYGMSAKRFAELKKQTWEVNA